jgi:hypothetical protein
MRRISRSLLLFAACGLIAGCGGGGGTTRTTAPAPGTTSTQTNPTAALEQSARATLEQNHTLSDYVLTHNAIPRWAARSTSGPALTALRKSAAQRRAGKVHVRLLTSAVEIRSVQLDPSYQTATASVIERSRVRVYQHGRPVGGIRALNEPANVELHREGDKPAFVVWKLAPA